MLKFAGIDVVSIEKSGEHFRLLYDVKGRFTIHRITGEEATYKLLKVRKVALGARGVPYVVTHDGRTIRYPDPAIRGEYHQSTLLNPLMCTVQSTTLSSLT
jgi:ribosomal protein S4E